MRPERIALREADSGGLYDNAVAGAMGCAAPAIGVKNEAPVAAADEASSRALGVDVSDAGGLAKCFDVKSELPGPMPKMSCETATQ